MSQHKFRNLQKALEDGDSESIKKEAIRLVETEKLASESIFQEFVKPYLDTVGERFSRLEIFLPDMMLATDGIKVLQAALTPYLKSSTGYNKSQGVVVIGTVYGDIHDIGKNIVKSLLEVGGFDVVDLGVSIPARQFVERARDKNADVIALSCLLSSSFSYIKDTIELIKANPEDSRRFKIIVGGGPVTKELAASVRADAYGHDATEALSECRRLCIAGGK